MKKVLRTSEIADAAPISAIDALRRNLLYAMLSGVKEEDVAKIATAQVEKAKAGDTKAAKLVIDMLSATTGQPGARETFIREEGGIVEYKVEIRKLIVCLIAFNGPQSTEDVAARLHLPGTVAVDALMCQWFKCEGGRWYLTNDARNKVLDVNARLVAEDFRANSSVDAEPDGTAVVGREVDEE